MSCCPTTSSRLFGRYFSTQISFILPPTWVATSWGAVITFCRRDGRIRHPRWSGGSDLEFHLPQDGVDGVQQGRHRAAREQEAARSVRVVDDEGAAVPALREEVADDLPAEHGGPAAVVHRDDGVEARDPSRRQAPPPPPLGGGVPPARPGERGGPPAVVHRDDGVEARDPSRRQARRAPALPHPEPHLPDRPADPNNTPLNPHPPDISPLPLHAALPI